MKCVRCHQDNPSHAKFCLECGTPFTPTRETGPRGQSYEDLQHALTEALQQQTATADVLKVISRSAFDLQTVLDALCESAVRLCDADHALLFQREGEIFRYAASFGLATEVHARIRDYFKSRPVPVNHGSITGRAALEARVVQVADVLAETDYAWSGAQDIGDWRAALGAPLLREGRVVGVIFVAKTVPQPFTDKQIELVETFANQAVIAIENVRLFNETKEALEQQIATAEILRVIASSPTDLQPVFDAIAASAVRLCSGLYSTVARYDGEMLHLVATNHTTPDALERLHRAYPRRLGTLESLIDRAISEGGRIVHVLDVETDPTMSEWSRARGRALGYRSILVAPMLQEGRAIGAVSVSRAEPTPFSDEQIALLETFANQAVIAIENVRLFTELQEKNRALTQAHAQVTEALDQQTATGEILRVIASSPTDLQPVMDTVAENAARVCGAIDSAIFRFDGEVLRFVAQHGVLPRPLSIGDIVPARRGHVTGRAVLERRTIHVEDLLALPETEFPETRALASEGTSIRIRTLLATPLLREGVPLGAILIRRADARPFSARQIELLETFANQAVIAIENVRLFHELQARNAELTESLEQQTATAEILRVISSSPTDVQPVFDTIARSAVQLCEGDAGAVIRLDGELAHLVAAYDIAPDRLKVLAPRYPMRLSRAFALPRAIVDRAIVHIPDTRQDPDYDQEYVSRTGGQSLVAVPLLREGRPIGAIAVSRARVGPFSDDQIRLLKTFADQAVIAIENVRLFNETKEALDQQTATGEILRVIASSPTDLQPVFDTIAESAARLCGATDAAVRRVHGEFLQTMAVHGPAWDDNVRIRRDVPSGRAVLDAVPIHIHDIVVAARDDFPGMPQFALERGVRTMLAVPLLREGVAIGVITIRRHEVRPFADKQIALLQTFADQAVIAIENVRLFKELEVKNRDLTEALEQQTATSEILRVISSSPTDVQPVFDTIVQSAARLCGATRSNLLRFDGELLSLEATFGFTPADVEAIRKAFPQRPGRESVVAVIEPGRESAVGRAVMEGQVIHIPDVTQDPQYRNPAQSILHLRTVLAVPMLREGIPIGAVVIWRSEVRPFSEAQSLPTARVLLLVNYRPEYRHDWGGKTYYRQLRLDPLAPENAAVLLETLLGSDAGLEPLKRLLLARTEGNPLLPRGERAEPRGRRGARRRARWVSAREGSGDRPRAGDGAGHPGGAHRPAAAGGQGAAPDRLGRRHRRPDGRARGRRRSDPRTRWPMAWPGSRRPSSSTRRACSPTSSTPSSTRSPTRWPTEASCRTAGARLHARAVEAIERCYPERLAEHVERLAHHALRGEVWEKAVPYLRQAGAKAMERSAYREAAAGFDQALDALQHLPESRARTEQAIDLHLDASVALGQWAGGRRSPSMPARPSASPRRWATEAGWGGPWPGSRS